MAIQKANSVTQTKCIEDLELGGVRYQAQTEIALRKNAQKEVT